MPIDSYKPPPRIPGVLYQIERRYLKVQMILLMYIGIGILYLFHFIAPDLPPAALWIIGIFFFAYGLMRLVRSSDTVFIHVSATDVTARLINGKSINHDDLKNYVLYIDTPPKRTTRTSAYRYRISLARTTPYLPKNKAEQQPIYYDITGERAYIFRAKPPLRLLLVDDVTTPQNVREWTDAFQSQIASPLPILFKSDQLKRDFDSGIYQCPLPKS